jgi:hypothetical protein
MSDSAVFPQGNDVSGLTRTESPLTEFAAPITGKTLVSTPLDMYASMYVTVGVAVNVPMMLWAAPSVVGL